MQDGPVLALLGEFREQDEREEKSRVSSGPAEELEDDIKAKALAVDEENHAKTQPMSVNKPSAKLRERL